MTGQLTIKPSSLLAALLLALLPITAKAQDLDQRAADIAAAMQGQATYEEVFAPAFTSAVPQAQFAAIRGQLESQLGPLQGVEAVSPLNATSARITLRFAHGRASGQFTLDPAPPHAVAGFVLRDIQPLDDSAEQLLDDLGDLPGEASVLITRLSDPDNPLAAMNAGQRMAVGSTFKLWVLSALAQSIAAGEHSWDEVVPLTARSFPSGQLHLWPAGSPLTLHTLATMMISNSDNTATDQLIAVLGRDAVEAELLASGHGDPSATLPLLTTREMFVLKSASQAELAAYRAADRDERLAMLADLAGVERSEEQVIAAFSGSPVALDVEWLASGEDIVGVMRRLAALEDDTARQIMAVNTALSAEQAQGWSYAGYKGGSEPGVINMSWLLRDATGEWSVVTLSWNNPQASVDNAAFALLATRAVMLAAPR
ncbi:MAG: serine hydrolase [Erythrobacter sp.]|nr:serine hydrolase [Erythrobacter sp.]